MTFAMRRRGRTRDQGAVLVTGMVFLIVLTMFVLAMVRGGTLEERMARNARDRQVALEAAEAVLRYAETQLFTTDPFDPYDGSQFSVTCNQGLCFNPPASLNWETIDWSSTALTRSFAASSGSHISTLVTQPRYIVEILTPPFRPGSSAPCEPGLTRVTARGTGNGGATVFVQSTVRFRVFSNICD